MYERELLDVDKYVVGTDVPLAGLVPDLRAIAESGDTYYRYRYTTGDPHYALVSWRRGRASVLFDCGDYLAGCLVGRVEGKDVVWEIVADGGPVYLLESLREVGV